MFRALGLSGFWSQPLSPSTRKRRQAALRNRIESLEIRVVPADLYQFWLFNGQNVFVRDTGSSITLTDELGRTSSAQFTNVQETRLHAVDWGQFGTLEAGHIRWDNGRIWTVNLNGPWVNGFGSAVSIQQNGESLVFIDRFGNSATGSFQSPTRITTNGWGNMGVTVFNDRLEWDDGTVWRPTTAPAPQGRLYTNWTFNSQAVQVLDTGTTLSFTNERGQTSSGSRINATTVFANDWGIQGTLSGGHIDWANGTRWTVNLAGNWRNAAGAAVSIEQNGESLTFVDRFGARASGTFLTPTRISTTGWGNMSLTVQGDRLLWDDGSFWFPA